MKLPRHILGLHLAGEPSQRATSCCTSSRPCSPRSTLRTACLNNYTRVPVLPRPREDRRRAQPGPQWPGSAGKFCNGRGAVPDFVFRRRHRLPRLRRPSRRGHRRIGARRSSARRVRPAQHRRRLLTWRRLLPLHPSPSRRTTPSTCWEPSSRLSRVRDRLAEDSPSANMADVWLALLGQRQRVPFVCLRRTEGWLSSCAASAKTRSTCARAAARPFPVRGLGRRRWRSTNTAAGSCRVCRASFHASRPSAPRPHAHAD